MFDFLSIKKTVSDAAGRLKELQTEGNNLRGQLATLDGASVAKSDFVPAINRWVDEMGDGFSQSVRLSLADLVQSPRDVANAKSFNNLLSRRMSGVLGSSITERRGDDTDSFVQMRMLCALFGPQIKKVLAKAVDEMSWDEGLPLADRPAARDRISSGLKRINAEVNDLRAAAAEAGVKIQ